MERSFADMTINITQPHAANAIVKVKDCKLNICMIHVYRSSF